MNCNHCGNEIGEFSIAFGEEGEILLFYCDRCEKSYPPEDLSEKQKRRRKKEPQELVPPARQSPSREDSERERRREFLHRKKKEHPRDEIERGQRKKEKLERSREETRQRWLEEEDSPPLPRKITVALSPVGFSPSPRTQSSPLLLLRRKQSSPPPGMRREQSSPPSQPQPQHQSNMVSGVDRGATFAVWNLWDLGGGPRSRHWTPEALGELPGKLAEIGADVLGLLEIKTGKCWTQLPLDKLRPTAFELGAMIGLAFYLANKIEFLRANFKDIQEMIYTGEEKAVENGLLCCFSLGDVLKPLKLEVGPAEEGQDVETIVNEVLSFFSDKLNWMFITKKDEHRETRLLLLEEMYLVMASMCNGKEEFEGLTFPTYSSGSGYGVPEFRSCLKATWKNALQAFKNAGTIQLEEEEPTDTEAKGVEHITKALGVLKGGGVYDCVIIPEVKGDGETTAFAYNKEKFRVRELKGCVDSLEIRGTGFSFRSAGCILLDCRPDPMVLHGKSVLAVAWHAPSEKHAGDRGMAYIELIRQIDIKIEQLLSGGICKEPPEVVLFADMNIRKDPFRSEPNIKDVYKSWTPSTKVHMDHPFYCTSLKMTGEGDKKWNHPFDKVLLLKKTNRYLKITKYWKMSSGKYPKAESIRVYSDHSWLKARIEPK